MSVCARSGCSKPVFIEPRTQIAHKYCGRTHALEVEGRSLQVPRGRCHTCNLDGCYNSVAFDSDTGRVHDFCCKDHANTAIAHGQWALPAREHVSGTRRKVIDSCFMPDCFAPVYHDECGQRYDYCGRSHAIEHRLLLSASQSFASNSASSSAATSSGVNNFYVSASAGPSSKFSKLMVASSSSSSSGCRKSSSFSNEENETDQVTY